VIAGWLLVMAAAIVAFSVIHGSRHYDEPNPTRGCPVVVQLGQPCLK
jgi:hypothetical protein